MYTMNFLSLNLDQQLVLMEEVKHLPLFLLVQLLVLGIIQII